MPITASLDTIDHILRIEIIGTVTMQAMISAVDRSLETLEEDATCSILSDHRRIGAPATVEQVEAFVEHLRRHAAAAHGRRWAIVTTSPASFGMMRMLSVLAKRIPMTVEVFQDMAAAEHWLAAAKA
jgi:hypothetical protein